MASANLDFVRSIVAAGEWGDYSSAEWTHPEIEYVHAGGPDPGNGSLRRQGSRASVWVMIPKQPAE
jgi:hypothetical protein